MKILFYSWDANCESFFADGLKYIGHEVVLYAKKCKHYTRDMEMAADMISFIHMNGVEAVASFDYFPIVSLVCDTVGIRYYSWVFDCPHFTLYAGTVSLSCNRIGVFDKGLVEQFNDMGINTLSHIPLAGNDKKFEVVINKKAGRSIANKFKCDISFVGSLYTNQYDYFDSLTVESAVKDESLKLINKYLFDYSKNYYKNIADIEEKNDELISCWADAMGKDGLLLGEDYFIPIVDEVWSSVFEKKITVEERRILLSKVAELDNVDFRLYTNSNLDSVPILSKANCGIVDYHTQMPLVFNQSKINLNITLRSIHTGIPLRVLDILSCGGFVLSNYQEELDEYFKDGEELVLFSSLDDAIDKIKYYLNHDVEREKIAANGLKAVKERFTYEKGIKKLLG